MKIVVFFSSRRRHTRYWRDWSSDVCSSDLALALVAAALVVPALAGSASSPVTLKVRACETGDSARERLATFYARMRAVPGTERTWMRFTLIDRTGGKAELVPTPKLAKWRKSRPRVKRDGFTQTVIGLDP